MVRENDAVVASQGEIGRRDEGSFDLAMGLAELDPGHVADSRLFDPARIGDGRPHVHGRTTVRARQASGVGRQPAKAADITGPRSRGRLPVWSSSLHSLAWWWYMDWIPTRPGPVISAMYMPRLNKPVRTLHLDRLHVDTRVLVQVAARLDQDLLAGTEAALEHVAIAVQEHNARFPGRDEAVEVHPTTAVKDVREALDPLEAVAHGVGGGQKSVLARRRAPSPGAGPGSLFRRPRHEKKRSVPALRPG